LAISLTVSIEFDYACKSVTTDHRKESSWTRKTQNEMANVEGSNKFPQLSILPKVNWMTRAPI